MLRESVSAHSSCLEDSRRRILPNARDDIGLAEIPQRRSKDALPDTRYGFDVCENGTGLAPRGGDEREGSRTPASIEARNREDSQILAIDRATRESTVAN